MSSKLDSIIAGGLLLALVFTAAAFGAVETWSISIFELIVALLTAIWLLKCVRSKEIALDVPLPAIALAGLVLWGAFQSLKLGLGQGPGGALSLDPGATRSSVQVFFFMTLAFVLAANAFNNRKRYQLLARFLSIFAFVMALFALVQHFAWNGAYYWLRPSNIEGFGPFANRDHFAGYMEMLAPVPLALVLARAVEGEKKALYIFATIMAVIAAMASLSRGGMLGLGAEAVFLALWSARSRTRQRSRSGAKGIADYAAQAGMVMAVLGAVAIGVLWVGAEPLLNRTADTVQELQSAQTNYLSRQWIWRDTLSMVKAHPITGVGLGSFRTVFPAFGHSNGDLIVAQAHNDYLQVLADCGVIGVLLALGFVGSLIYLMNDALKSHDRVAAGLALGCCAGLLGMLIHSVFDFNLQIPSNGLLFLVLAAAVSAISAARRKHGYEQAERIVLKELERPAAIAHV